MHNVHCRVNQEPLTFAIVKCERRTISRTGRSKLHFCSNVLNDKGTKKSDFDCPATSKSKRSSAWLGGGEMACSCDSTSMDPLGFETQNRCIMIPTIDWKPCMRFVKTVFVNFPSDVEHLRPDVFASLVQAGTVVTCRTGVYRPDKMNR